MKIKLFTFFMVFAILDTQVSMAQKCPMFVDNNISSQIEMPDCHVDKSSNKSENCYQCMSCHNGYIEDSIQCYQRLFKFSYIQHLSENILSISFNLDSPPPKQHLS